ncbi:SMI1/KNR4 family protein [Prevotella intermedia]|uniref:SMI1/KNR4 family protein n=1 Tax=Prevotella intermedia TaxID=28131 RepID=A0A2D3N9E4_PREIN|nr:SMI1/KNR4 family protein [Prevotella intermedia]ATV51959.1 SMI1/KNR4 family protein [Prevotella intermedia]
MDIKSINDFISFSRLKEDNKDYDIKSFLDTVKDLMGKLPNKDLLDFIYKYGFAYFNVEMVVAPMEKHGHSKDFIVGPILGFGNTPISIEKNIRMFYSEDQIGMKFFPICEGASGDLIIYSLEQKSFGKVYYWSHDSAIGNDTSLIGESFNDFINRIKVKQEEKDNKEIIKVKYSSRLLKLINAKRIKDGLPPLE